MEISRELILGPADLDRISIKCKSCSAELLVSLGSLTPGEAADRDVKQLDLPAKCPVCPDEWTELPRALKEFRAALEQLKEYSVSFRVHAPEEKREPAK